MVALFRTLFIFLVLLTTRGAVAQAPQVKANPLAPSNYNHQQATRSELDQLISLKDFSSEQPKQTSDNLNELMFQAKTAQAELSNLLDDISDKTYTQALVPEVKSYQRAQHKVTHKLGGDASKITDLARASIVADDVESLMYAYKKLTQRSEVIQLKNRFANPKPSGYRDLNTLVRLPDTQMIVEVQLHLNDIANIKSGADHDTYIAIQQIEANAQTEHRPLSEYELSQITQLRQDSHKLYHKAWLTYKRQSINNASFSNVA
ncbi:RelA/SpoT domain-containing protein [Shewanella maritima]|uniref:RelA/SpoT domain-containing protein n=1 Tax=Shewanella maritima TaxID=2520507 RepID=UPI003734F64B